MTSIDGGPGKVNDPNLALYQGQYNKTFSQFTCRVI